MSEIHEFQILYFVFLNLRVCLQSQPVVPQVWPGVEDVQEECKQKDGLHGVLLIVILNQAQSREERWYKMSTEVQRHTGQSTDSAKLDNNQTN